MKRDIPRPKRRCIAFSVSPWPKSDRRTRPEGKTLSPSGTLESKPEPAESQHEHDHAAETHEHTHGPVLNPECTRELVIDVSADDVAKAWRRVAANYRKYAKIPGFRPGKVPENVIRRRFAAEIRKEVIDTLLPERFNKAVNEQNVRPVGQPQVTELTLDEGGPLHAKAVFEILPAFSIDGYKDVTVPKPSVEVTDEEFQHELEHLRESRATVEPVEEDRALKDGDWAQISYKGQIERARPTNRPQPKAKRRSSRGPPKLNHYRRRHAGRNRRQRHRRSLHQLHCAAQSPARNSRSRSFIPPTMPRPSSPAKQSPTTSKSRPSRSARCPS